MKNPEAVGNLARTFVVVIVNYDDEERSKTYLFGPFADACAAIEWRERGVWVNEVQSDMDGTLTYQIDIVKAVRP